MNTRFDEFEREVAARLVDNANFRGGRGQIVIIRRRKLVQWIEGPLPQNE